MFLTFVKCIILYCAVYFNEPIAKETLQAAHRIKMPEKVLGILCQHEAETIPGPEQIPPYGGTGCPVHCEIEMIGTEYRKWRPHGLTVNNVGAGNVLQTETVLPEEVLDNLWERWVKSNPPGVRSIRVAPARVALSSIAASTVVVFFIVSDVVK
jgi:hypothetical protein